MERIDFLRHKKELGLHVPKYSKSKKQKSVFLDENHYDRFRFFNPRIRENRLQKLEELDISMHNLYSRLEEYDESDPMYKETLNTLASQFQLCKSLNNFEDNFTYEFKFADLDGIKELLVKKGYEEESSKALIKGISEVLEKEVQPKVKKITKDRNNNKPNN